MRSPTTPLLIITLLSTVQGWTAINLKNGSLEKKISTDMIEVNYSSRSLFEGLFGFGWCSEIDIRLLSEMRVLTECEKETVISLPVRNPKKDEFSIKRQHDELVFDRIGRLKKRIYKNGRRIEIDYASALSRLPNRMTTNRRSFSLYYSSNRISSALGSRFELIDFKYRDNALTEINLNSGRYYKFQYDEMNNMIRYSNESKYFEEYSYDLSTDRILAQVDSNGCSESYSYRTLAEGNAERLTSELERSCRHSMKKKITYDFWFLTQADGSHALARAQMKNSGIIKNLEFDTLTGRLLHSNVLVSPFVL